MKKESQSNDRIGSKTKISFKVYLVQAVWLRRKHRNETSSRLRRTCGDRTVRSSDQDRWTWAEEVHCSTRVPAMLSWRQFDIIIKYWISVRVTGTLQDGRLKVFSYFTVFTFIFLFRGKDPNQLLLIRKLHQCTIYLVLNIIFQGRGLDTPSHWQLDAVTRSLRHYVGVARLGAWHGTARGPPADSDTEPLALAAGRGGPARWGTWPSIRREMFQSFQRKLVKLRNNSLADFRLNGMWKTRTGIARHQT